MIMNIISSLENDLIKGLYGDHEDKNEGSLNKIKEIKNLLIFQIVQHKNSLLEINKYKIDGLELSNKALNVVSNKSTRILWFGPKNWLFISNKTELKRDIEKTFGEKDFAVTDLSHSRAIIELEGENSKEILKKGCPYNFNELKKNMCINSVFNGITITIDMIEDNPCRIRLFALRSFGSSLYHSITDASLEYGYKVL